MVTQQVTARILKHVRLPFWKRLMLLTTLLLSAEPLATIVSGQSVHTNSFTYIACSAGPGGEGGVASHGSSGGTGGSGGDCVIHGIKGGTGGTSNGAGASGGDIFLRP